MKTQNRKGISLSPLSFDEAVTDILNIEPGPKATKKRISRQKARRPKANDPLVLATTVGRIS
jgi:hypothetical protein